MTSKEQFSVDPNDLALIVEMADRFNCTFDDFAHENEIEALRRIKQALRNK